MAYSIDFIERAVAYRDSGKTLEELREAFGIPAATYYDWKTKLENGFVFGEKAKQQRNRKIDKEALEQAVKNNPDAFLSEYAELFNCTPVAIFYALENLNITRKKRLSHFVKNQKQNVPNIRHE
jgi:transposase